MSRRLSQAGLLLALLGLATIFIQLFIAAPDAVQFLGRAALLAGGGLFLAVRLTTMLVGAKKTDALVVNLAVLLVTVLVGLLVCEFALRFVFRDVTTTVDFNSYFSSRWRQGVELNQLGFRAAEVTGEKPQDTYRIAVIGDSFTYGQGVPRGERFTERLQQRLEEIPCAGRKFQVVNLGRPGAETVDHVNILQEVALPMDPDFVLLQWYENDVEGDDKSGRPRAMPLLPSSYLNGMLRQNSVLYYLLQGRWSAAQAALGWVGSYESYMKERFLDPDSEDSRAARAALAAFFATARQPGVPTGMILFPDPGGQRDLVFLHHRVLGQCQEENITCADLSARFAAVDDPTTLWASRLDRHPGKAAHQMAADLLMETYASVWLTGCPQGAGDPAPLAP